MMMHRAATTAFLAAAALLLPGCDTSNLKSENEKQAEIIGQQKKLNQEMADTNALLNGQVEDLERKVKELEATTGHEKNVANLSQEFDQKLAAMIKALQSDLQESVRTDGVEIIERPDRTIIRLPDRIVFASGSADLSASGKAVLDKILDIAQQHPQGQIRVEGHTDSDPIVRTKSRYSSNWDLSCRRAVRIVEHLDNRKKVPGRRLCAVGFGENQPISKDKAANRRVEIAILKN